MKNRRQYAIAGLSLLMLAAVLLGYTAGRARAAGVPSANALTYSGVLTDKDGNSVAGSKNIQLQIWDAQSGGTKPVCSVGPQPQILVAGRFQIALPDACVTAIHATPNLWVEVLVDDASLGRTKLGAVPYALEAQRAAEANAVVTGGTLDKRLTALEGPRLAVIDQKPITRAELSGDSPTHWDACVAGTATPGTGNASHCGVIAKRRCGELGYKTGFWVGECFQTCDSRIIACIK